MKPGTYVINNQTGMITITQGVGKGNRCILKSDEQPLSAFEGGRVDRAGVDEEISQTKFNALCVRTTDTGGQVLIAATLINGLTYLYYDFIEPWQKGERKDVLVVITGWKENPVLDEKSVMTIKDQLAREDPLLAAIRFGGQFLSLDGKMVFDGARIGQDMKSAPNPIGVPWEEK